MVFLIIEKRNKEVRFHAAQALLLSAGLTVLWIVLSIISSALLYTTGLALVISLIMMFGAIAAFAGWVVLMVFAYQGKRINIPVVSDAAEQMAGKLLTQ